MEEHEPDGDSGKYTLDVHSEAHENNMSKFLFRLFFCLFTGIASPNFWYCFSPLSAKDKMGLLIKVMTFISIVMNGMTWKANSDLFSALLTPSTGCAGPVEGHDKLSGPSIRDIDRLPGDTYPLVDDPYTRDLMKKRSSVWIRSACVPSVALRCSTSLFTIKGSISEVESATLGITFV